MKCKNKEVNVAGIQYMDKLRAAIPTKFRCIITNDEVGKTLSIDNGEIQFTIPFEPIAKYLR